jgi:hypothetical protein
MPGRYVEPSGSGGLPILAAHASGAPKLLLVTGDCSIVGSTVSCDGLLDRP